ncbi:MAG: TonB family protein [Anaeromyxobacter sp.]
MTPPRQQRFLPAVAAAVVLHAAALGWLTHRRPPPPPPVRSTPAVVKLVTRPPKPPRPPDPGLAKVTPTPKPTTPAPRPAQRPVARAEPPPEAKPAETPPSTTPAAPRRFAVSMGATVPGGGVAVPTTEGPTAARGDARLPSSAPVGNNPGTPPVEVTEVERPPRLLSQPTSDCLRALYPEQARREGLEGDVRLELLVNAQGSVEQLRIVQRAGHGFDEVAETLRTTFRFQPAERQGRPVAVWIPWTLKFRLDG